MRESGDAKLSIINSTIIESCSLTLTPIHSVHLPGSS